jgi:predicted nucleic acid-binding protein
MAYPDPNLRSFDAIHLATARRVFGTQLMLSAFVSYDRRLLEAAAALELPTSFPGMDF